MYDPAAHFRHEVGVSVNFLCCPMSHIAHELAPSSAEYCPAAQTMQYLELEPVE